MKLVAYDLRSMIITDGEVTSMYRDGIKKAHDLSAYAITRLGEIGFKVVDQEVSSLEEAWDVVIAQSMLNHRVLM